MHQAITAAGLFLDWVCLPRLRAAWHAWIEAERGRYVPWLAMSGMAGVAAYFAQRAEPPGWAGLMAALGALLACVLGWRRPVPRAVCLVGLAAAAGFLSAQMQTRRALPIEAIPAKAAVLTGVVRGVDILPEGRRVTLSGVRLTPDAAPLARTVRVRLRRGDAGELAAGDRIQLRSLLRAPAPPAYPGAWDLQRDAFFSGLGASGYALNPAVPLERAQPTGPVAVLQGLRDGIAARVMAGLPGAAGAVAGTLLTGTTASIPQADREALGGSGLAHLLAVAGLHIGIVMGLVMGATRLLLAAIERTALHWPNKAISGCAALAVGGCYLLLTGAHVPIMRSFAMACLVTLGIILGRRALSLRGLTLAAAAIMMIAPNEVAGVSFQMSFAAVLALISGYEALRPLLARLHGDGLRRRVLSHVVALTLTSLLAGTASAPHGAYHFGHVQLYFIVANLLAVPLTAFWVMPAGLAALTLMTFGMEQLALAPMGWGIEGILWIGRTVASWPAATLAVPAMPGLGAGGVQRRAGLARPLAVPGQAGRRAGYAGGPAVTAGGAAAGRADVQRRPADRGARWRILAAVPVRRVQVRAGRLAGPSGVGAVAAVAGGPPNILHGGRLPDRACWPAAATRCQPGDGLRRRAPFDPRRACAGRVPGQCALPGPVQRLAGRCACCVVCAGRATHPVRPRQPRGPPLGAAATTTQGEHPEPADGSGRGPAARRRRLTPA